MAVQQANGSIVLTAEEFAAMQVMLAKANTPAKVAEQPVARIYHSRFTDAKKGETVKLMGIAYAAKWNDDGTPGFGGKKIQVTDNADAPAKLREIVDAMHAALHATGGTPVATAKPASAPRPTSAPVRAASFASALDQAAIPDD